MTNALLIAAILLIQGAPGRPQTGAITGQLRSLNGTPAVRVRVAALAASDSISAGSAALVGIAPTDEAGRYRLEGLPPGRYHVIAGALEAPTYFPGVPFQTAARTVVLTDGLVVNDVNFQIVVVPPLAVRGRVLHNGDTKLLGASARIVLTAGSVTTTANIAQDGTFAFPNVRPGRYQLSIPGGGAFAENVIDLIDRDVLGLELRLTLTEVKGHVRDPGVTAVEFHRREAIAIDLKVNVGANGAFELKTLPGAYALELVSASAIPLPDVLFTLPPVSAVSLELSPQAVRPVIVRAAVDRGGIPPKFILRIQGAIAQGRALSSPPPGTTVIRSPASAIMGFAIDILPAADGTFRIFLPEGHYEFGAGFPDDKPAPLRMKSIESAGINIFDSGLTITSVGEVEIKVVFTK